MTWCSQGRCISRSSTQTGTSFVLGRRECLGYLRFAHRPRSHLPHFGIRPRPPRPETGIADLETD